jgi:hypothetical protein
MKRCDPCGGRFGLIRYRHYAFCFCRARCLESWMQSQRDRVRQLRFLEWLRQGEEAPSAQSPTVTLTRS